MTWKSFLGTVSFAAAILAFFLVQASSSTRFAAGTSTAPATPVATDRDHLVRVYYFHTTWRCASCKKIEALADQAIRSGFASELADGRLEWVVVNIEEPANRHFISDYKLYTKSLIVVDFVKGTQKQWKNLEQIWQLLRNDSGFKQYVQDQVKGYLEPQS